MNLLTRFKDLTVEALKDNKKLIIGLYLLFLIVFIVSWMLSGDKINAFINTANIPIGTTIGKGGSDVSAVELFFHNEWGGIITYVSSVFFGIPAIVILIFNAMNLGLIGQLFNSLMPNGGLFYIVYLVFHGVFEITATVLQSVAGLVLFRFIWMFIKAIRSDETVGLSDSFDKTKKILIQSIVLMIFATILLLIAAPIEAYVSLPLAELLLGH